MSQVREQIINYLLSACDNYERIIEELQKKIAELTKKQAESGVLPVPKEPPI